MDIVFWNEGKILSHNSKLYTLIQADTVTLNILNKNNGRIVQNLHHDTTGTNCAVTALARLVHHIISSGGS